MAAEGYRRLLGRPSLDLLQTTLREAIQNVADATVAPSGALVLIRLRTLGKDQHEIIRRQVFADLPADMPERDELLGVREKKLRVLEICDFGTMGLSGSTRADQSPDGSEPQNFVNFLRNVGAPRDTEQGGGTYGYGKSALYAMSRCSTIIVDSQTSMKGAPVRRLMACHLGAAFDAAGMRYTGRHWWGILADEMIEPLTSSGAEALSCGIGLPPRGTGDTGTSIQILDPDLGSGIDEVGAAIIEAVLWNFWPRMVRSTPANRRLVVRVEIEGLTVDVPSPEDFPPLDLFAAAMELHRQGASGLKLIQSQRPKAVLGLLAIQNGLRSDRHPFALREGAKTPAQCSHIALMRPAELIVRYLEGEPYPDAAFEWAGVFICSAEREIEEAFALAEPPAHDDWIPDNLPKGRPKTFVRVALRDLMQYAKTFAVASLSQPGGSEKHISLAAVAARMGGLLDQVSVKGPGKPVRKARQGTPRSSQLSASTFDRLELDQAGNAVAVFSAEVTNDGKDPYLVVVAEPHLIMEGSATDAEDLGDDYRVEVSEIRLLGPDVVCTNGARLKIGGRAGRLEVRTTVVPHAALGLRLSLARS